MTANDALRRHVGQAMWWFSFSPGLLLQRVPWRWWRVRPYQSASPPRQHAEFGSSSGATWSFSSAIANTVSSPRPITRPREGSTFSTARSQISCSMRVEVRKIESLKLFGGMNAGYLTSLFSARTCPSIRNRLVTSWGSTAFGGIRTIERLARCSSLCPPEYLHP